MSDITREEDIIKSIKEMGYDRTPYDRREVGRVISKAIKALENQKTGHWISKPNTYGVVYCSECDYELHTNNTNYCANCGAKMEGEKEDNWFAEMEEAEKRYEHEKWVESLEKGEQE